MPWYYRVRNAINAPAPFLAPTQQTNLALLLSAILKKRTLCLSELARAYPTPKERRVPSPKHDLLHRLKRLWRFTDNERIEMHWRCNFCPGASDHRLPGLSPLIGVGHRLDLLRHHIGLRGEDALPGLEGRRAEEGASATF